MTGVFWTKKPSRFVIRISICEQLNDIEKQKASRKTKGEVDVKTANDEAYFSGASKIKKAGLTGNSFLALLGSAFTSSEDAAKARKQAEERINDDIDNLRRHQQFVVKNNEVLLSKFRKSEIYKSFDASRIWENTRNNKALRFVCGVPEYNSENPETSILLDKSHIIRAIPLPRSRLSYKSMQEEASKNTFLGIGGLFPWASPGELEKETGVDTFLPDFLKDFLIIPGVTNVFICRYEVTQDIWKGYMGANPSANIRYVTESDVNTFLSFWTKKDIGTPLNERCPVECVSYDEIKVFLQKVNENIAAHHLLKTKNGNKVIIRTRLPTYSEWNLAYNAGKPTDFDTHKSEYCWFSGNAEGNTHDVGKLKPNTLGVYDMAGNVSEWTSTPEGTNIVVVGGSYCYDGVGPFAWTAEPTSAHYRNVGFRLCVEFIEEK